MSASLGDRVLTAILISRSKRRGEATARAPTGSLQAGPLQGRSTSGEPALWVSVDRCQNKRRWEDPSRTHHPLQVSAKPRLNPHPDARCCCKVLLNLKGQSLQTNKEGSPELLPSLPQLQNSPPILSLVTAQRSKRWMQQLLSLNLLCKSFQIKFPTSITYMHNLARPTG